MWLFISHALPVGTRLRGKDTDPSCPHCGKDEDICHMAYDCPMARDVRYMVFREWWHRTGDLLPCTNPSFTRAFFGGGKDTLVVLQRTLNDIATYQIWSSRCRELYDGGMTSPERS